MSADSTQTPAEAIRLLLRGLDRRRNLPGGAGRAAMDDRVLAAVAEVASLHQPPEGDGRAPPREVVEALGRAVVSQPYLAVLFGHPNVQGTEPADVGEREPPDPPLAAADFLEGLGLARAGVDLLREQVDRRAGEALKQARMLRWLWAHYRLPRASPEPLFRALFPGAPARLEPMGLLLRGIQLYAVVDKPPLPPGALSLPWALNDDLEAHPLHSFDARYVDPTLRRRLGRAIGADDDEVIRLLDQAITLLPRQGLVDSLRQDTWRVRGFGALTGLQGADGAQRALFRPLEPEDVEIEKLFRLEEGRVLPIDPRGLFDKLAEPRAEAALRALHATLLSRLVAAPASPRAAADLDLFDVSRHLQAALQPIADWAADPRVVPLVANRLQVGEDAARQGLAEARALFLEQRDQVWCTLPSDGLPLGTLPLVAAHLCSLDTSLRDLLSRPEANGVPHRDLLLLFTGHALARGYLRRLHSEVAESQTWPPTQPEVGDVAQSFWGVWNRLLRAWEE